MNKYILIIKTSSLGDIIQTLPALTDASQYDPNLQCDWVVEEGFAEIPTWHPSVNRVIPVAFRRWRKQPWQTWFKGIWHQLTQNLTQQQYDYVIDAQGLLKSAVLTYYAQGCRSGFNYVSAREPLAALFYQQRYHIPKGQHAVTRLRQLFAAILDYPVPHCFPDYGIVSHFQKESNSHDSLPTIIFLHGTTWITKHWPDSYWVKLAQKVTAAGYAVRLPWSNSEEYDRAQLIATVHPHITLIPKSHLQDLAYELSQAQAVVGVDTGLSHLAAALNRPSVSLYGATQPSLTGTYGSNQIHLQAEFPCAPCLKRKCTYHGMSVVSPPCYESLSVERVWETLMDVLK